jgi:hypothetical protein
MVFAVLFLLPAVTALGVVDGNDGTVKIHEGSTETEPIIRNEPHVCTFHLHFFFADPIQSGTWEVEALAPDDSGGLVLSGTYDTTDDGEDRQPTDGTYSLPDGHYKLFWQGRDEQNVKHKAFWVACAEPLTSPTGSDEPTDSASPTGSEEPVSSGRGSPDGGVLPLTGTPPATPPATDGSSLEAAGSGVGLVLAAILIVVVTALVTVPKARLGRR